MNRPDIHLPLYDFFDALRKNGFSLGIAEYQVFLEALSLGHGIDRQTGQLNFDNSLKLCKTLWLKPNQSKFVFEQLFQDNFALLENTNRSEHSDNKNTGEQAPKEQQSTDSETQEKTNEIDDQSSTSDLSEDDQPDENPSEANQAPEDFPLVKFVLGDASGESVKVDDETTEKTRKFFFSDYYFDLSKRQMQQVCRFLPVKQASRSTEEIDIPASVEQFAKNGLLAQPVFKSRERITNQVLLLIDYGGSMLAFDTLVDTFAEALQDTFDTRKGEAQQHIHPYYFYNVPGEYCYTNKSFTSYQKTQNILQNLHPKHTSVIIISDAGAARGGNSDGRFRATLRFVLQLKKATSRIVWLNPMPEHRRKNTTAQRIGRFVKMQGLDTQSNLQKAINILRGK